MCVYSYYTRQMKIAAVWKAADMAERIKYFKKIPQVQFYKGHSMRCSHGWHLVYLLHGYDDGIQYSIEHSIILVKYSLPSEPTISPIPGARSNTRLCGSVPSTSLPMSPVVYLVQGIKIRQGQKVKLQTQQLSDHAEHPIHQGNERWTRTDERLSHYQVFW